MRKVLRMTGIIIASIIGSVLVIGTLFLNFSPQFGRVPNMKQKGEYSKLENFQDGKFTNLHPSPMEVSYWKIFKGLTRKSPNRNPTKIIDVEVIDSLNIVNHNSKSTKLTWFGHSTFLLEIDGQKNPN